MGYYAFVCDVCECGELVSHEAMLCLNRETEHFRRYKQRNWDQDEYFDTNITCFSYK